MDDFSRDRMEEARWYHLEDHWRCQGRYGRGSRFGCSMRLTFVRWPVNNYHNCHHCTGK